jgi:transmembrane sensor
MKEFETNEEIIYGLIVDDLDNALSIENKRILEQWRQASLENEKVYQEFFNVHINIDKLFELKGYDPQSSWEVLDRKISRDTDTSRVVNMRPKKVKIWYGIAASIMIIISAGYYFGFKNSDEIISSGQQATYVVLPDSTRIDLNSATRIRYNKRNFLKNRKLELLSGEVFINIVNHKLPQFKLVMGEVEAFDIGTSFSVIRDTKVINVVVENGVVALRQPSINKEVMLTAGKLGTYNLETKSLTALDNLNPNYKSWINKEFVFNEVPLRDVVDQLSDVYKEPILIKDAELKNRKFSAKMHYQTLDSVIAVISASLQCKAVKSEGTYIISTE